MSLYLILRYTILHPIIATMQHPFQLYQQEVFSILSILVVRWQKLLVAIKKDVLLPFINVIVPRYHVI